MTDDDKPSQTPSASPARRRGRLSRLIASDEEGTAPRDDFLTEAAGEGGAVALPAVADSKRFKKPNEAIGMRVAGNLTLGYLHRKVLNVMMATAQHQKAPGRVLPPFAEVDETCGEYFWAPLSDYCRDAGYGSNDLDTFKIVVQELQELKLVQDNGKQFLSEVPISSVRLILVRGQYWVGVALAPEARASITHPKQYTPLLLYYQTVLSSGPAVALYEICRRYLTNKVPYTKSMHWSDWYYALSGRPVGGKLPEFKYWRRDTLKRIEADINSKTDIRILRHEDRGGRRSAGQIQYEVHENEQTKIPFPGTPPIDTELLRRLMDLGLTQRQAEDLAAQFDEGLLLANLAIAERAKRERRIASTPFAYLRAALQGNYAGKVETAKQTVSAVADREFAIHDSRNKLEARFLADRAAKAFAILQEVPQAERVAVEAEFAATLTPTLSKLLRVGSEQRATALGVWYAKRLFGDTVAEGELLEFAAAELARTAP